MVSFSNSAWIPEDSIYPYLKLRDKYQGATRIPRGFKEAIEAIEDAWQALPVRSGFCSTCHTGFLKSVQLHTKWSRMLFFSLIFALQLDESERFSNSYKKFFFKYTRRKSKQTWTAVSGF